LEERKTKLTTHSGVTETVQTFYTYELNAAKMFKAKGVNVILSSQTPNNVWEGGVYAWSSPRFATYAKDAAAAAGATYVDHGIYTASLYQKAGSATVNSYYPHDHTHTSPAGANVVARAFVLGLEATTSTLKGYVTHD
jgi:rhamnogalacturonan acetylesterase